MKDAWYDHPNFAVFSYVVGLDGPYGLKQAADKLTEECDRHEDEWFWIVRLDPYEPTNSEFIMGYNKNAETKKTQKSRTTIPTFGP